MSYDPEALKLSHCGGNCISVIIPQQSTGFAKLSSFFLFYPPNSDSSVYLSMRLSFCTVVHRLFSVVFSAHIVMIHPLQESSPATPMLKQFYIPTNLLNRDLLFLSQSFTTGASHLLLQLYIVPFPIHFSFSTKFLSLCQSFTVSQGFSTMLLFCLCLKVSLEDRSE